MERISTYNNPYLYESDEMSSGDSIGTLYVYAGRNLGAVLPQFHGPSCRRDKGGHPPIQLSWSSMAVTLDCKRNYCSSMCGPSLNVFKLDCFPLSVRVPNGGCILKLRTDKRDIGDFSHFLVF